MLPTRSARLGALPRLRIERGRERERERDRERRKRDWPWALAALNVFHETSAKRQIQPIQILDAPHLTLVINLQKCPH